MPKNHMTFIVNFFKDDGWIVAEAPALQIASHGKTEEEARANLDDAINGWLEICQRKGTLKNALIELGWTVKKEGSEKFLAPPQVKSKIEEIRFPKIAVAA